MLTDTLKKISSTAEAHWTSQLKRSLNPGSSFSQNWTKPPLNWLKINADSSFFDGSASTAFIVRNHNGSIVFAHSLQHQCTDSLVAEALAIHEACLFANHWKIAKVIFESDCLNAVHFINDHNMVGHWSSKVIIDEIRKFWHLWPKWRFKYCPRNANFAAHNLASWASASKWSGFIFENRIPISCFCDIGYPLVDSLVPS
ncbi:PREDICTED: uncharacterized protein LOC105966267 isoform X2 [Erythranthe guttata]|uniref:uncharacterized protein LOC105966267 isoform X2 n=1 Tax=Erythranthe guttata TaxID=4155 RepID=UPI00064E02BB|nr:PREDICTED: uncharacterized protein LOC105966267 isoform X2 [Erythranthe guttata]|eukprot:XP_012846290.1 PREDICTED: uncharacterized protein LOC105966267 isoform X2 [Erythranthe guttata]